MSGKQHKRELKAHKRAEREAARRKERQRTMVTGAVIAGLVVLGGVLIWLSYEADDDLLAEEADEVAADERPVACGAQEPPGAGQVRPTYPDGPQDVIDRDADHRAVITTSCGEVVVDLDTQRAPETVNSFAFLADEGFFDGLEIFRSAPSIGVLQTGAGSDDASWDVGYTLPDELAAAEADGYPAGAVAMANAGPDTAGSQFFFVYTDDFPHGADYTRFGSVVEGLDVLEEIGGLPVEGETPQERAYLESVVVEEAR